MDLNRSMSNNTSTVAVAANLIATPNTSYVSDSATFRDNLPSPSLTQPVLMSKTPTRYKTSLDPHLHHSPCNGSNMLCNVVMTWFATKTESVQPLNHTVIPNNTNILHEKKRIVPEFTVYLQHGKQTIRWIVYDVYNFEASPYWSTFCMLDTLLFVLTTSILLFRFISDCIDKKCRKQKNKKTQVDEDSQYDGDEWGSSNTETETETEPNGDLNDDNTDDDCHVNASESDSGTQKTI